MRTRSIAFVTLKKLLRAAATLLLLTTLVFAALRASGDPARILLPHDAPPAMVAAYANKYGLDRPIAIQYLHYLSSMIQGDLGGSYINSRPVAEIVAEKLPATLALGLAGILLAIAVGVPTGVVAALRRGSAVDRSAMTTAVALYSMPTFFFGVLMMLLFSVSLHWVPSAGAESWRSLILPAASLGLGNAALLARFTRSSLCEIMQQPFILAAQARGVPLRRVILRHALPNAAIALMTVAGLMIGSTIVGAIVTETVFAWPGLGSLFIASVSSRDIPVVQAIILMSATTMICVNVVVDLLYGIVDPRIRTTNA
ncbi:ABC transporter permease [Mesorhizobium sp.]|uniref:ABC transporter permease n=1 Tax=Mesorhizobium sp. TaxID=1871066 RepID=UPI000FE4CD17|nr:ABC transporter permease [Mesorhizobium sp.]RWG07764.1 MAG: ABC transporter permease [Mesorhizobium sp.]RWH02924.1 MAG: ABC transporter permease [Mesorhizobium sp.]TIN48926.1 MAG: ABC transporter permease [Mesorhizobium sp.]TIR95633.1 MAG: ABC transporter permease [Mesorhizobium sp.]TIS04738.1 MAG: ABC transporter permease [Mesorhizobium sp.]